MPTISVDADLPLPPNLDLPALEALAARVMIGESIAPETTLALLITGDSTIQQLNRDYLGEDHPTDVLSFPAPPGDPPHLGDIAISLPTAGRQATELGHDLDREFAHLLVHGILHLCGFDHLEPGDRARMEAREEHYLGDLSALHRPSPER